MAAWVLRWWWWWWCWWFGGDRFGAVGQEMVEEEVGEELRGWMEGRGSAVEEGGGGVEALFTRHLSKLVLISVTQLA